MLQGGLGNFHQPPDEPKVYGLYEAGRLIF
jgi:hypothetical protein